MENICRFCGIFSMENHDMQIIKDIIHEFGQYLPVKIALYDGLPQEICILCENHIRAIKQFYDKVIVTDNNFRKKLNDIGPCNKKVAFSEVHCSINGVNKNEYLSRKNFRIDSLKTSNSKQSIDQIINKINKSNTTISKVKSTFEKSNQIEFDIREPKIEIIHEDFEIDDKNYDEDNYEDNDDENSDEDFKSSGDENIDDDNSEEDNDDDDDEDYGKKSKTSVKPKQTRAKQPKDKLPIIELNTLVYVCSTCRAKFPTFEELKIHMDTNTECINMKFSCNICSKFCGNRKKLHFHRTTVHGLKKVFKCSRCSIEFSTENNYKNHQGHCTGNYDEDSSGIMFRCKECDRSFTKRQELLDHVSLHPKSYLCDTCGKNCSTKKKYQTHLREHLKLKPFPCGFCDKAFRSRPLLQAHSHVHTGIKQFVCDMCFKAFAKKASLISHKRLHTGERPYSCNLCEERFTTLEKCKSHNKKHLINNL